MPKSSKYMKAYRSKQPSSTSGASAGAPAGAPSYHKWEKEAISSAVLDKTVSDWKGSSSAVRHAINGRLTSSLDAKTARQFDDWLNSGSYTGDIMRGKRLTKEQFASLRVGDIINQDGPASFSTDMRVACHFADYSGGNLTGFVPAVFVLKGGTKAGRYIADMANGKYADEEEVAVGSSSHMRITSIRTEVHGDTRYRVIEGREIKAQYKSPHK